MTLVAELVRVLLVSWHVINYEFHQMSDSQNAPIPENLSLEKLSPELMAQVSEALAYPVIPLCPDGQQLGSGVLVEVDGVSGILTAEHVIFDTRFQKATGLWTIPHLHSEDARDKPTTHFTSTNIQMDLLRCYPETPKLASAEWGPDSPSFEFRVVQHSKDLCERLETSIRWLEIPMPDCKP